MILVNERLPGPVACEGLLVIGDPHVGSRRPGRRKDGDWPGAILRKLEACVALANARGLQPVLLGDLFERAVEPDEALKARLIRVLKRFRLRPIANVGNHDIAHTTLSDGDSLAVLGLADVIDIAAAGGPVADILVGGRRFGLGMTPFGEDVPRDLSGLFPGAERTIWFTHHDIAFAAAYPGAVPPFAVHGADLVVNGHVHKTEKPVRAGPTLWANPGTINRLSVDLLAHRPAAWVLGPDGALAAEMLPCEADVFDLTGRLVAAAGEGELTAEIESAFVSLLRAESATDLAKSDDGSIIREEVLAAFERGGSTDSVRAIVLSLLDEAVERRARG